MLEAWGGFTQILDRHMLEAWGFTQIPDRHTAMKMRMYSVKFLTTMDSVLTSQFYRSEMY